MLLSDLLPAYLRANLRVSSPHTRYQYRLTIRDFGRHLGRPAELTDLTDDALAAFARDMQRRLSPATVNQRLHYAKAFWRWCCRRGFVSQWPTMACLPASLPVPQAWTIAELRRLMDATAGLSGHYAGTPRRLWWTAWHLVQWDTGERTGAMRQLRWDWLVGDILSVPAAARKSGSATYILRAATLGALEQIRPHDAREKPMFPFSGCLATFYQHYHRLLQAAGLDAYRAGPQAMRRTFATHLELHGEDATRALGHSSRSVTERYYLDPRLLRAPPPNRVLPEL